MYSDFSIQFSSTPMRLVSAGGMGSSYSRTADSSYHSLSVTGMGYFKKRVVFVFSRSTIRNFCFHSNDISKSPSSCAHLLRYRYILFLFFPASLFPSVERESGSYNFHRTTYIGTHHLYVSWRSPEAHPGIFTGF